MATQSETRLNLLCRDGALSVTFRPGLTPRQYDKFHKITEDTDDRALLLAVVEEVAKHWEIKAVVEGVPPAA